MLHEPLISAADVDPDVVQAIRDFLPVVEGINAASARVVKLRPGSREREKVESQIRSDMSALDLRAQRIGGDWTGASLFEAVKMDITRRARRTAQPRIGTERFHRERVRDAIAAEARAKTALDSARLELEAATSARMAAEHAAKHFETRRGAR